MTHTLSYVPGQSKLKVTVTVDWAGIPANTNIKLVGTSAETALNFESAVKSTGNLGGAGTVEITATNDVGDKIRTINGTIDWKMIVNPGAANEKTLSMDKSGAHKIYVLFGIPGKQDRKPFQATDIRMDRTVAVASQAHADAQAAVPAGTKLTWQRVAYHVAQLQKFNGEHNLVKAPPEDKEIANGWVAYKYWNYTPPGVDCITGATFAWLVVVASGMPGESSADALAPKSATEPTKAASYDPKNAARYRNDGKEELGMVDRSTEAGVYNAFEAALVYKPDAGASTFYFPIGFDARFTNKDDVISVMQRAVWVRTGTNKVVERINPMYTRAANVDID